MNILITTIRMVFLLRDSLYFLTYTLKLRLFLIKILGKIPILKFFKKFMSNSNQNPQYIKLINLISKIIKKYSL